MAPHAGVAELADAQGLGPCGRDPVEVQVLSPALLQVVLPACFVFERHLYLGPVGDNLPFLDLHVEV